ncbi:MAG: hypothetical protein R2824_31175 [Saprospiraceae bacterium]
MRYRKSGFGECGAGGREGIALDTENGFRGWPWNGEKWLIRWAEASE